MSAVRWQAATVSRLREVVHWPARLQREEEPLSEGEERVQPLGPAMLCSSLGPDLPRLLMTV